MKALLISLLAALSLFACTAEQAEQVELYSKHVIHLTTQPTTNPTINAGYNATVAATPGGALTQALFLIGAAAVGAGAAEIRNRRKS